MSVAPPARGWRPWPQSLAGQLLLVAALALLLAQAVNFMLLLEGHARESQSQAASLATARLAMAIEGRTDRREQDERRRNGRRRGYAWVPIRSVSADTPDPPGEELDYASERAAVTLAELDASVEAASVRRVAVAALPPELKPARRGRLFEHLRHDDYPPADEMILVSVTRANGQRLEATAPLRPRERGALAWLIGQTLILYLAVLLPLALFAWAVARPLGRLTDKARAFSGSGQSEQLALQGPADIRRLIAAFNAMQDRVENLLGEKDVMLGAIGHDLKTPLASLRLRVETLDIAAEDEAERDKMIATVVEMHAMLDDILTLARLGRSSEAAERTDPAALLAALADDYAEQGKAVSFDETGIVHTPALTLRPLLFRRALRNLVDNALLYGQEAVLSLDVDASRVSINITDNGPGVAEQDLEILFEPFRRTETSRNRATGGSGLGLTIARATARAHGGDVTLANRPGGGLVATFSVPRG